MGFSSIARAVITGGILTVLYWFMTPPSVNPLATDLRYLVAAIMIVEFFMPPRWSTFARIACSVVGTPVLGILLCWADKGTWPHFLLS